MINLRGLWRLLALVYVLLVMATAGIAAIKIFDVEVCEERHRIEVTPVWDKCATPGGIVAGSLLAAITEGALLFGSALAVRWVYRGLRPTGS